MFFVGYNIFLLTGSFAPDFPVALVVIKECMSWISFCLNYRTLWLHTTWYKILLLTKTAGQYPECTQHTFKTHRFRFMRTCTCKEQENRKHRMTTTIVLTMYWYRFLSHIMHITKVSILYHGCTWAALKPAGFL